MINTKTSELTGNALSYILCMIELPHLVWGKSIGIHAHSNQIIVPQLPSRRSFSPFMDWMMCGPIIERELIALSPYLYTDDAWQATLATPDKHYCDYGPTPLVAAMRCYCRSKLGDEVEIPKELA